MDDQRIVGAIVRRLLSTEADIELQHCDKATDAVAYANRFEPTLILQDLVMPEVDGFTLVRLLRENRATAHTPIVVLSGNDDVTTRARAHEAGATDFLLKVPPKSDLVACIRKHAGVEAPASSLDAKIEERAHDEEAFDPLVLASFPPGTPGSTDFVRNLLDLFVEEATSQVAALRRAVRSDASGLRDIAHSLKGSSMTLGAKRLASLCAQLEEHAKGPVDETVSSQAVAAIERELGRVRDALAKRLGGNNPSVPGVADHVSGLRQP